MGRAATGRLLRVLGRAAQQAREVAQVRPVGSCRARHGPWLIGSCRVWIGPNFTCRMLAHLT
jgi:hypothetical protein